MTTDLAVMEAVVPVLALAQGTKEKGM